MKKNFDTHVLLHLHKWKSAASSLEISWSVRKPKFDVSPKPIVTTYNENENGKAQEQDLRSDREKTPKPFENIEENLRKQRNMLLTTVKTRRCTQVLSCARKNSWLHQVSFENCLFWLTSIIWIFECEPWDPFTYYKTFEYSQIRISQRIQKNPW